MVDKCRTEQPGASTFRQTVRNIRIEATKSINEELSKHPYDEAFSAKLRGIGFDVYHVFNFVLEDYSRSNPHYLLYNFSIEEKGGCFVPHILLEDEYMKKVRSDPRITEPIYEVRYFVPIEDEEILIRISHFDDEGEDPSKATRIYGGNRINFRWK